MCQRHLGLRRLDAAIAMVLGVISRRRRAAAAQGASHIFMHSGEPKAHGNLCCVEREFFARVRPSSLLKRFEKPEEVAAVVAFVASAQGAIINGAALRAEGGVVRSAL
jgi:NAD(P)-dependent dehydrogenase (short-subunit alcohol dehydrogenase family)